MEGYKRTQSSPSQIKKLQGLNESIAQGAATVGALLAGVVLDIGNGRWALVMWYALPSIVIANIAVVLLMLYERCERSGSNSSSDDEDSASSYRAFIDPDTEIIDGNDEEAPYDA